jgi:hypothetical protein
MRSEISGDILTSIKQCPTPLNNLFFSDFNQGILQRGIRENVYQKYKVKIDYQNRGDLIAIMRVMFIANSALPDRDICQQVKFINGKVIDKATEQIATGVAQYYGYIKDINTPITPIALPHDVSVYGNKLELNAKIGF